MKSYLFDCSAVYKIAGEYLHQRFIKMGLSCPMPKGAFYLFPNFDNFAEKINKKGISTSNDLAKVLLDEIGVAMLPGDDFYRAPKELSFRVATTDFDGPSALKSYQTGKANSYIIEKNMPNLIKGCDNLEKWLNSL